jgi:hypothetical protein
MPVPVVSVSKKKIADGRHHGLEPDSWLQSQTVVAAHTLDRLKINSLYQKAMIHMMAPPHLSK